MAENVVEDFGYELSPEAIIRHLPISLQWAFDAASKLLARDCDIEITTHGPNDAGEVIDSRMLTIEAMLDAHCSAMDKEIMMFFGLVEFGEPEPELRNQRALRSTELGKKVITAYVTQRPSQLYTRDQYGLLASAYVEAL